MAPCRSEHKKKKKKKKKNKKKKKLERDGIDRRCSEGERCAVREMCRPIRGRGAGGNGCGLRRLAVGGEASAPVANAKDGARIAVGTVTAPLLGEGECTERDREGGGGGEWIGGILVDNGRDLARVAKVTVQPQRSRSGTPNFL